MSIALPDKVAAEEETTGCVRRGYLIREPLDEAIFVEIGCHANERGEPRECIPCCIVAQAFLPGDNVGDEHDTQA